MTLPDDDAPAPSSFEADKALASQRAAGKTRDALLERKLKTADLFERAKKVLLESAGTIGTLDIQALARDAGKEMGPAALRLAKAALDVVRS